MIPFMAFCTLMITCGFVNFKHEVKSHQLSPIVIKEDPALKQKGINLPGYNHEEPKH